MKSEKNHVEGKLARLKVGPRSVCLDGDGQNDELRSGLAHHCLLPH